MWTVFSPLLLFFTIITSFFATLTTSTSALHPDEFRALGKIATTLGIKSLNLSSGDPCHLGTLKFDIVWKPEMNITIGCDCTFNNNTTCHITELFLKSTSLSGKLPPELAKLRYLQKINLCRNYLSGTIPMEWASLPYLSFISLCANNLSGNLPTALQNFKSLTYLGIEANQFYGPIPDELGYLTNLTGLELASNQFTGILPSTLARLVNLEKFRICDNNFTGIIPEYIGNWSQLQRLDLYASGLKGPIPDAVARLENLVELTISDTTGINSFPNLSSNVIKNLILRNVGLSGPIPSYIWNKPALRSLDLSFNKLTGELHGIKFAKTYTYLTGNLLSGNIESGVFLNSKSNIDLSYNNFSSTSSSCQVKRPDDEDIKPPRQIIQAPLVPSGPMTRTRSKSLEKKFNMFIEQLEHEGLIRLDQFEDLHLNLLESSDSKPMLTNILLSAHNDSGVDTYMELKPFESSFQNIQDHPNPLS